MENKDWLELIEQKRTELIEAIEEAERRAIREAFDLKKRQMRDSFVVLLWQDGTVDVGYSRCEDNQCSDIADGEAIEIARQFSHLPSDYEHPEEIDVDVVMESFIADRIIEETRKKLDKREEK